MIDLACYNIHVSKCQIVNIIVHLIEPNILSNHTPHPNTIKIVFQLIFTTRKLIPLQFHPRNYNHSPPFVKHCVFTLSGNPYKNTDLMFPKTHKFMKHIMLFIATLVSFSLVAQQTTQEKLGYPKNTKLLIIHADDIGVSHSENAASIAAIEKGSVSSGSIMVPCPWMPEIAEYAKAHPNADLGLHLTLTSEWKNYKWGPVTPRNEVASLVDKNGFFPDNTTDVAKNARPAEVEKELRAQIERAKQFGIDPTHFDTHMGSVLTNIETAKAYIKLGHEYKVPVLVGQVFAQAFSTDLKTLGAENDVLTENLIMAEPKDYKGGMKAYYINALKNLKPGLNVRLLHAAHNDEEMKAVTIDHPDYGAEWRQADFDFFTSDDCKKVLQENNIKVVTWKEIRDKVVRK